MVGVSVGQVFENVGLSRQLAKYKLHLVGVEEVIWGMGGTEPADGYTFFCGNGYANRKFGKGFFFFFFCT
jgi:hypothetical protein